jgi:hypothetical protein
MRSRSWLGHENMTERSSRVTYIWLMCAFAATTAVGFVEVRRDGWIAIAPRLRVE